MARKRGDEPAARAALAQAARRVPDDHDALVAVGRAQFELGEHDAACAVAERALELDRDSVPALSLLVDALLRAKRFGPLHALVPLLPADEAQLGRVARVAERARTADPGLALEAADKLLAANPKSELGIFVRASVLDETGHRDQAAATIEAALAENDAGPLSAAVRYFARSGALDRADAVLARVDDPTANVLNEVGRAVSAHGELHRAVSLFQRALAANPEHVGAGNGLERVRAELRVFSGEWAGPRPTAPRQIVAEPGRVLHLVSTSLPDHQSGYSVRTHYLLRAQREAGLAAEVMTEAGFGNDRAIPPGEPETIFGVPYHRIGTGETSDRLDARLRLNVALATELAERLRPAVLHPASPYTNGLVALELRERLGIPVVFENRGFRAEGWLVSRGETTRAAASERYAGIRDGEALCVAGSDRVVTLAEVMKSHLVEQGTPAEKVDVVPNAVDVEAFTPPTRDGTLAASLGIEPGETVVGYISSLVAYEGIPYLIEAIAELRRRGQQVRGLIVGDGPELARLKALAGELGIADRVVFTGRVPHADILRYYGLIDCFVVPRTAARVCQLVTPLKPFEAMATARALVVSGTEALREIVRDGETGCLFESESSEALADVLEPLIEDPARRAELGEAAREWVARERTWRRNAQRYLEIYERLGAL